MKKSEEFAARLSENASLASVWQSLLSHPGWKLFEKTLEEQRNVRLMVLTDPLASMGAIFTQEFMKGEASGIFLAMKLAETQLEMLKLDAKRIEMSVQLEEHNEAQVGSDVSGGRVDNGRDWFGGEPSSSPE